MSWDALAKEGRDSAEGVARHGGELVEGDDKHSAAGKGVHPQFDLGTHAHVRSAKVCPPLNMRMYADDALHARNAHPLVCAGTCM